MKRDCYIPPDEREWMKTITQAGRNKGFEYGDGATVLGSFVKCLSHLTKAMKIMAGFTPAYTTEELERHIFKCVWWLYRALYLLRGKQNDDNYD